MGGAILQTYYGLFIIMIKYMSSEMSESQDAIFCDMSNIEREIDRCVTEKFIKKLNGVLDGCMWFIA